MSACPPLSLECVSAPVTRGFTPCRNRTYLPRGVAGGEKGGAGQPSPSAPSRVTTHTLRRDLDYALRTRHLRVAPEHSMPKQIAISLHSFISRHHTYNVYPCESFIKITLNPYGVHRKKKKVVCESPQRGIQLGPWVWWAKPVIARRGEGFTSAARFAPSCPGRSEQKDEEAREREGRGEG